MAKLGSEYEITMKSNFVLYDKQVAKASGILLVQGWYMGTSKEVFLLVRCLRVGNAVILAAGVMYVNKFAKF